MPLDTILYIDDEQFNLSGFKSVFWKHYNILLAENTLDASILLAENEIKVIICDQKMPNETGLEFFKRIVNHYPDIICIILTAFSDVEIMMQAINQGGIHRYMLKPWDKNEMLITLNNAIKTFDLKNQNKLLIDELMQKNIDLQNSEKKFRNIFNTSSDGVFITDIQGNFLDANQTGIERSGIRKEDFLKLNIFDIAETNIEELKIKFANIEDNVLYNNETSYTNRNGQKVIIEIGTRIIDYDNKKALLHMSRDITDRRLMEQRILQTIIDTEEKERSRMAKELHDGVAPVLSAAKIYAQSLTNLADASIQPYIITKIEETILEAIQSVSEISINLSPHILQNFGLVVAIQSFANKVCETKNIAVDVSTNYEGRLPSNIEINLYRICIELLNNTLKYAHASKVQFIFNKTSTIEIIYIDNGCGFDYDITVNTNKGMGLFNINNRIKSLNGEIIYITAPSKGTRIEIKIPL